MPKEIDWSKAPEGATHIHGKSGSFLRAQGGQMFSRLSHKWLECVGDVNDPWMIARPTEPEIEHIELQLVAEPTMTVEGYEKLANVLQRAYDQASAGKGKDRHANNLPFHLQPMQQICDQVGVGFAMGQAIKKAQESLGLPRDRAIAEVLGAINYLAGVVIFMEKQPTVEGTTTDKVQLEVERMVAEYRARHPGHSLLAKLKELGGTL